MFSDNIQAFSNKKIKKEILRKLVSKIVATETVATTQQRVLFHRRTIIYVFEKGYFVESPGTIEAIDTETDQTVQASIRLSRINLQARKEGTKT